MREDLERYNCLAPCGRRLQLYRGECRGIQEAGHKFMGRSRCSCCGWISRASLQTFRAGAPHHGPRKRPPSLARRALPPAHSAGVILRETTLSAAYSPHLMEMPHGWVAVIPRTRTVRGSPIMFVSPNTSRKVIGRSLLSAMGLDTTPAWHLAGERPAREPDGLPALHPRNLGYKEQAILLLLLPSGPR